MLNLLFVFDFKSMRVLGYFLFQGTVNTISVSNSNVTVLSSLDNDSDVSFPVKEYVSFPSNNNINPNYVNGDLQFQMSKVRGSDQCEKWDVVIVHSIPCVPPKMIIEKIIREVAREKGVALDEYNLPIVYTVDDDMPL